MIMSVFVAHILLAQSKNIVSTVFFTSISPGITMSLLAFISACLLADNKLIENNFQVFLFKRLTRIYIPLVLCLTFAVALKMSYGLNVQIDHLIYNYLGLGLFFDWLKVPNNAIVGRGTWFVTAIIVMYMLLPALKLLFKHKNKNLHFILLYIFCETINFITMPPATSFWNVAISFSLGVYLSVNGLLSYLVNTKLKHSIPLSFFALVVCMLSSSGIINIYIRNLMYPVYPIVFAPMFFGVSNYLPIWIDNIVTNFSEISFEFYILQFYFINGSFIQIFGSGFGLLTQIIIGFSANLFVAAILAKTANVIRKSIDAYFELDKQTNSSPAKNRLATAFDEPM